MSQDALCAAGVLTNETIWGTLCACLVVHPRLERDPDVAAALERTIMDKTVLRGPVRVRPTPVWFSDHPKAVRAAPDLVALEARPRRSLVPRVLSRLV